MKQFFIALTILALVGSVIVAFNGQSDAASGPSVLAQSEDGVEPEELEPESLDERRRPAFSASGNLSITLPDELAEMAGDIAACLNESGSVAASFDAGVLFLEFTDLGPEDLHGIMKECDLPWPGRGRKGPHHFGFDGRGLEGFRFGFPEGLEGFPFPEGFEGFEGFPEEFGRRFEGFLGGC